MKALYFEKHGGPEVQIWGDVPDPVPGANEVVVRVKACACNYNDLWARRGMEGLKVPLPHISGTDTAGVVEKIGAGVDEWKPGDEVIVHPIFTCRTCLACTRGEEYFCRKMNIWGFTTGPLSGGFAELCKVPSASLVKKPANLSFEDAATLPAAGLTTWRMLVNRARINPGDTVLVWGAGSGIGAMALQVVKLFGGKSIAVTRGDARKAYAKELGADWVLDRDLPDLEKEISKITARRGVEGVFEHSGQETWPISVRALRYGGWIVVCGATSGFKAETDLRFLWNKQLTFFGSHIGTKSDLMEVVRRCEDGRLKPLRHHDMPMRAAAEAQAMMESSKVVGKIVLVP